MSVAYRKWNEDTLILVTWTKVQCLGHVCRNFIEGLQEGVVQSSSQFGHVKWIRQYYLVTVDTLLQQKVMSLEVGVIIDWD